MTPPVRRPPALAPAATSAAIAVAVFLQAPGRLAPETKLDLAVDPVRFMGRALRLWNAEAAFGHIQNQAAGYLFPTGPFFALGQLLPVPMWMVQRAWMAAILVIALWGALRVAEALDIGSPATRLIGASAYALSPVFLAQIAYTSAGLLPAALMPWALWALVRGSRGGSPRRWAAASGLAVAAMGAVNATATLAALILPALFLVTRAAGPRKQAMVRWWLPAAVLATAWWVIPLLLQGRYGFNFLPYTESADVTGTPTSAFEVVRGTGYWLTYLHEQGPWLPAGWTLVGLPVAVAATGAVAAAGLAGLARRDVPERTFLVTALGVGTAIVAAAYTGPVSGPGGDAVRDLLTGPLAPLRNLHKFEPVLRLPLALGLAHALTNVRLPAVQPRTVAVTAAVAVALTAAPLLRREVVVAGAFEHVPVHWEDTAAWLGEHDGAGRALVVPAAAFGEYRWGRPLDEPLQPLARSPWAVRDLIPLGSEGATRLLDGIGARLDRAEPVPGLAATLAGAGVRYVVVRNDLDLIRTGAPPPAQLRRALAGVPGLRLVHRLGPAVPSGLTPARLAPDMAAADHRAVEIYEVSGRPGPARLEPGPPTVLAGGPEGVLGLDSAGLPTGAVTLAGDGARGNAAVTDSWRRRDVDFGEVRDNYSYVLAPREPAPATGEAPRDHVPAPAGANQSVASMRGAALLSDSSEGTRSARPEHQPYAAFDGVESTAWVAPVSAPSAGAWIEVRLARPIETDRIDVSVLRDRPSRPVPRRVRVTTDGGERTTTLRSGSGPERVAVATGATTWIRVTIESVAGGRRIAGAGFREIDVAGLRIDRTLAVPPPPASTATYLFERSRADPYDLGRTDEEPALRRQFSVTGAERFTLAGTVTGRPGPALDRLIAAHRPAAEALEAAEASSTWRHLPAFAAGHAVDGDSQSVWVADPDDPRPVLRMAWPDPRTLTGVRVAPSPGPTRVPTRLRVVGGGVMRDVRLDGDGTGSFPPLVADAVEIRVVATALTAAGRAGASPLVPAPVGVSEIGFEPASAVAPSGASASDVDLDCGSGPPVLIDGTAHATAVSGTLADLIALRPLRLSGCAEIPLEAGAHRLEGTGGGALVVDTAVLAPAGAPAAPPPERTLRIERWGPEDRRVTIGAGPATHLAVAENFNSGWRATLDGERLEPVELAGWKQGWRVPEGGGGVVRLTFAPGDLHRAGLAAGAVGLLALLVLASWRGSGGRSASPAAIAVGQSHRPALAFAGAVLVALGGVAGAALTGLALLLRWRPLVAGTALGVATVLVTVHAAASPGWDLGAFSRPVQALTLLALAATLLPPARRVP